MKQISAYQSELIEAVLAEKAVGGLTAAILEKDIHITEVLHKLAGMQFAPFSLVFCGGTSLAKTHGIIERMSEDIDFKILLADHHTLSRNAINTQLKQLKQTIIANMDAMGFMADMAGFVTQNENRYFSTAWFYQSHYRDDKSLRPHLILEFTLRPAYFPIASSAIGYLVYQLAEIEAAQKTILCAAVEETLAEKVLSFLRRYARHRAAQNAGEVIKEENWDSALVRHIYDVYCIVSKLPNALISAQEHFKALVELDCKTFSQHTEFVEAPHECLLNALLASESDLQIAQEYNTRLLPLIYGSHKPDFSTAFAVFKQSAKSLIAKI